MYVGSYFPEQRESCFWMLILMCFFSTSLFSACILLTFVCVFVQLLQ